LAGAEPEYAQSFRKVVLSHTATSTLPLAVTPWTRTSIEAAEALPAAQNAAASMKVRKVDCMVSPMVQLLVYRV